MSRPGSGSQSQPSNGSQFQYFVPSNPTSRDLLDSFPGFNEKAVPPGLKNHLPDLKFFAIEPSIEAQKWQNGVYGYEGYTHEDYRLVEIFRKQQAYMNKWIAQAQGVLTDAEIVERIHRFLNIDPGNLEARIRALIEFQQLLNQRTAELNQARPGPRPNATPNSADPSRPSTTSGAGRPPANRPPAPPSSPSPSEDSGGMPEWLRKILEEGNKFDEERSRFYPHNEVYVETEDGWWARLDSYNPRLGEIVSRKYSQLASVQVKTAIGYLQEFARLYKPGTVISDVPTQRPKSGHQNQGLRGQKLQGQMILEVPVQTAPIPKEVLDAATFRGIIIRDVQGKVYNPPVGPPVPKNPAPKSPPEPGPQGPPAPRDLGPQGILAPQDSCPLVPTTSSST